MKAAVLTGPGRIDTVMDWPEPVVGPGDVLVDMGGVGLCGSDLTVFDGKRLPPATPWVMGHEGYGRITVLGADVRDRAVGDLVAIEPNYSCLRAACPACRTGRTSACPDRAIVGMNAPGVLAERCAVPAAFAHPVAASAGLTGADLACVEPYAVARTAVQRSQVTPADRCLVIGAGAQGLLVCLALLELGIKPAVTEPHPQRLARAEQIGATIAADSDGDYTYLFETSGHAPALRSAVRRAAPGATAVLIGLSAADLPLTIEEVVRRQLVLRGSLIYDHPGDFGAAIADLEQAAFRPSAVIDAGFPLEAAQEAFAGARERAGKTWIRIGDNS